MFSGALSESILKRAQDRGILSVGFINPRDFALGRHKTVDDRPYGGGAGMLLMAEPLYQALRKARRPLRREEDKSRLRGRRPLGRRRGSKVILLSPQGRRFDQELAASLARERHIVLLCGHYEGVDERILDFVDMELSIGDFVLSGGEIPAMAVVDAVARLLPGVLVKPGAAERESFSDGVLDYPQYTRPALWRGRGVPEVLLSGDHARIEAWRRKAALKSTRRKRPDLLLDGSIFR
ncbi:MAG: tRNA (guanosine(37)-N1)-methyltransferase TrmD [Elusimicrobia bacterium]|nr:tRNA (guanosine(37)-N1)-methyltransferase TrmD [Elusimicrobiota bacterium]